MVTSLCMSMMYYNVWTIGFLCLSCKAQYVMLYAVMRLLRLLSFALIWWNLIVIKKLFYHFQIVIFYHCKRKILLYIYNNDLGNLPYLKDEQW